MWAVTSSIYDVCALCGLLQPLCIMYKRYVGCCILYACCICVMWAVASYMYDVQALCGLLYVRTLTLIIIKVQCTARNPNPNTVAATRRPFRRVAATIVGLGFRTVHCTFIMIRVRFRGCNSPHRGCNSPHSACTSHIEALTAHTAHVTVHI